MTHAKPKADLIFKIVKDGSEPSFYITFADMTNTGTFDLSTVSQQIQSALKDKGAETSPGSLITLVRFPPLNDRIIAFNPEAYGKWITDNTSSIKKTLEGIVRDNKDKIDLTLRIGTKGQGRSAA